jgi:hypothetical protein
MREEENYGYNAEPHTSVDDDIDAAWTPKEIRNLKILVGALAGVAVVCCGAGIGLGVLLA